MKSVRYYDWQKILYEHMDGPWCQYPCLVYLYGKKGCLSIDFCEDGIESLAEAIDVRRNKNWFSQVRNVRIDAYRDGVTARKELDKALYNYKPSYTRLARSRRDALASLEVNGEPQSVRPDLVLGSSRSLYVHEA